MPNNKFKKEYVFGRKRDYCARVVSVFRMEEVEKVLSEAHVGELTHSRSLCFIFYAAINLHGGYEGF